MKVEPHFFQQSTLHLAKVLLGHHLVHETERGLIAGKIVETEAYLGEQDAPAHSYNGKTERNRAMFGPSGHAYIYFTYGMYFCMNVVSGGQQNGEGILIRAVEPVVGVELMKMNRPVQSTLNLSNGPAKLVLAMEITKELYGHDLTKPPLYITTPDHFHDTIESDEVVQTTRVGISQAAMLPYRFYLKDNPFVSKK